MYAFGVGFQVKLEFMVLMEVYAFGVGFQVKLGFVVLM